MGHNISDRRARELDAQARWDAARGWLVQVDGRVDQVRTPAGVRARGGELKAICRRAPCSRRVAFDAAWWCEHGFSTANLDEVLATYRCGLVGCGLSWQSEQYPGGLPLGCFLRDPKASVRVACLACRESSETYTVPQFIERISRAGTGGAATSTLRLHGGIIRGGCRKCGEREWSVSFACPPPDPWRPPPPR